MLLDVSIITGGNEGSIYKANACSVSKAAEQIQAQPGQQAQHPLHKASIADELWKFASLHRYMHLVVRFEDPILALMKVDHDRQRFTAQLPRSLSLLVPIACPVSNLFPLHFLAESIDSAI